MPEQAKVIGTNTTPLIALTAATGSGRMRERGIWLSNAVISFALAH